MQRKACFCEKSWVGGALIQVLFLEALGQGALQMRAADRTRRLHALVHVRVDHFHEKVFHFRRNQAHGDFAKASPCGLSSYEKEEEA